MAVGPFHLAAPSSSHEENPAVAGVIHDVVHTLPKLVDGLVQKHARGFAVFTDILDRANLLVASAQRIGDLGGALLLAKVNRAVGWPLAPLNAVHGTQVVVLEAVGIGQH